MQVKKLRNLLIYSVLMHLKMSSLGIGARVWALTMLQILYTLKISRPNLWNDLFEKIQNIKTSLNLILAR
jgi:hypothetical protein